MESIKMASVTEEGSTGRAPAPLHGDILELMLSFVPLIDLVPAALVSRSWSRAVGSSLRHLNPAKPWLLVHTQGRRTASPTATHAYDPRSGLWMEVLDAWRPPVGFSATVRSSHSSLLYALSASQFSFSYDPLNLMWRHVPAPKVWREDPVVALVGTRVVVAGGAWDFEDDPLSVEAYNMRTGEWSMCPSMPDILKDSNASLWLSVAADDRRMYVTQKASGITYSYDPEAEAWEGPCHIRPDDRVYDTTITFSGDRLILVGLIGSLDNFESIKLWEVSSDLKGIGEISEIPMELGEKLIAEYTGVPSITVRAAGGYVYIHSPGRAENVVWCELAANGEGRSKWGWVKNAAMSDGSWMEKMVFTCATIGVAELEEAVATGNRRFRVKETLPSA